MRVFVNSQAFDVEGDSLTGEQIKVLSQTDVGASVFQVRGEHRALVADDETAFLQGDEQFVTVPVAAHAGDHDAQREITIFVDGDPYKTDQRVLTGEQIKALAKKPPGNRLFRIAEDGQRHQIADDENVHLHDDEQFVTLPPVGRAS